MATKKGKYLKGILGPLTLRELNGQQVLSSHPEPGTVAQTEATKKAADTFGMASALSNQIRQLFAPWIENLHDPGLVNRFNTDLLECLVPCRDFDTGLYRFEASSFRYLEGLEFNATSPLLRNLGFVPVVTYDKGMISLRNPGANDLQKIRYPGQTTGCELTVSVAQFLLADGKRVFAPKRQTLELTRGSTEIDKIAISIPVLEGCFCVVAMFLKYYSLYGRYIQIYNTKQFSPAGICGAMLIPGEYQGKDDLSWVKMGQLKFEQY